MRISFARSEERAEEVEKAYVNECSAEVASKAYWVHTRAETRETPAERIAESIALVLGCYEEDEGLPISSSPFPDILTRVQLTASLYVIPLLQQS